MKRNIETVIWVARGNGWHITLDRQTRDYAAFADGEQLVLLGFYRTQLEAEQACRDYTFDSLKVAAMMYAGDEQFSDDVTSPLVRPLPTRAPLYITIENDGTRAIITAAGPQYITNSRVVESGAVDATLTQMRRYLSGRDIIVKEFAQ